MTTSSSAPQDARDEVSEVLAHFRATETACFLGKNTTEWRTLTRAELGLPLDRPLIMTGHQAGIWHAGIAEKFVRASALAARVSGCVVHLVVDHDRNDASLINYPALVPTIADGSLTRLALERTPRGSGPNALRKPVRVMTSEVHAEIPSAIATPLACILEAVRAESGRANLALQMAHAANRLLAPFATVHHTITATSLAATTLGRALRANFESMRDAYNAALSGQRIARLTTDALPFWVLERPSTRRAFRTSDLANDEHLLVAPRALTLTALARLAVCDHFIHGTGGAIYERAMESWMSSVMNCNASTTLAPMSVATATRYPSLDAFVPAGDATATPAALRALEHDPFDDNHASKRALLAAIRGTRDEKRAAYVAMHRALAEVRATHAEAIRTMQARIAANATARAAHELARDRTWPFPFSLERAPS